MGRDTRNKKRAIKWFLRSESKYFKIIQNKDEKKEFKRNLKLAIANDSIAQNIIGNFYRIDKYGCKWYIKSVNVGCKDEKNNLGYCYEIGDKDDKKAFEWYIKSANAGCADGNII